MTKESPIQKVFDTGETFAKAIGAALAEGVTVGVFLYGTHLEVKTTVDLDLEKEKK